MIPLVLNRFDIQDPNDTHACYVTILTSINLSEAKDESHNRLFQREIARALSVRFVTERGRGRLL